MDPKINIQEVSRLHQLWLKGDLNGKRADLRSADLRGADLRGADLSGADLSGAKLPDFQICPEEGSFIAWKALRGVIAKLEITGERNSTLVGRKCRTSEAKVLAFYKPGEETPCEDITSGYSKHNGNFLYTVGGIVTPDSYNDTILVECTNGIHFFMTRKEAEAWL